ncbi:MOSC domain-containing protein [Janibacter sp. YIM B02568]|uniref:MOSC domain-containing protein n=1 Tax=Janibacter endophyticus TaxID=2806261 RepID=UPI001950003E|nr:MOSC domain-containing protein [Janibacter endophyticus]MBM6546956.1 MOSC domain-containing protein [Janibacter endophyticus]
MLSERPRVLSVNRGSPVRQRVPRGKDTGIRKVPVEVIRVLDPGPRRVEEGHGVSGVEGDFVGNGRHHGGSSQAVYAFAREELDAWGAELGRDLPAGMFGENLTTTGIDVDAAEIGDVWRVGTALLQVSGPRVPCATFAERMGERGWVRRFGERGRSGAYLAVLEPGEVRAGDEIAVEPGGSGIDVPTVLRALLGDQQAARAVVAAHVLREPHHSRLAAGLG